MGSGWSAAWAGPDSDVAERRRWAGRRSGRGRGASYGVTARRQMALIGITGVVLELVVVHTTLSGLQRVDSAYADVGRIALTQQYFQDADQAHDALHADVLQALLEGRNGAALPVDLNGGLKRDADSFRANLRQVDAVTLPGELAAQLRRLRPVQLRYVAAAESLAALAHSDPNAASSQLSAFTEVFVQLEQAQAAVTSRLGAEANATQRRAGRDERVARWRITAASLAALMGLLGLTLLLIRLGRAIAAMAARERGVAETLQKSLLPEALPHLPGVRLAARYVPGGTGTEVGGDWYDVIPLRTGAVGLVMGDVAGHDLRAASVMGQLRNALRAYIADGLPPGEALGRLNRLCLEQTPDEMATCLYAVLDPVAATLDVANAGHYAPFLLDAAGCVQPLEQPVCPPVGAVREAHYGTVRHRLAPGSTLALFTDGLVERRGSPVTEGLQRLAVLLATSADDLDALCDVILEGLIGAEAPADDVALLVVRPSASLGNHLKVDWPAEPTCLVELRRTLERWLTEAGADEFERYDVVVACSEAATNAIEHAYGPGDARFEVECDLEAQQRVVTLVVRDRGHWRSARGRDRGRGLQLVEGLMDSVEVVRSDNGTEVRMSRRLNGSAANSPASTPAQEQVRA